MQDLNTPPNDLLASALALADLGIGVIPLWWPEDGACMCPKAKDCSSPAKHPLTFNGLKDASTDIATITAWWTKFPQANVGMITGSEVDVIDVDGVILTYQALIKEIGEPEHIATVLTGRGDGGLHVYCTPGGNRTIPAGKHGLPPKIELKGVGGYVVAPPSRHVTGGTYTFITEITGAIHGDKPLVAWLAELHTGNDQEATVTPIRPTMPTMTATSDKAIKYRDAVIASACAAIDNAGEGGRWMALATEAVPKICRGIAGGLIPPAVGIYALETAARQAGLDAGEVARIPEMIDLMLAQGIRQPITPPQDTDAAADDWLGSLPKDDAGDLPPEYVEAVELTPYERAVRRKYGEMRVIEDAKALLATMKAGQAPTMDGVNLTEFLAEVEDAEKYRVDGLWPSQGRVLLAAQAKSGKTTMVAANLIPALVDGGDFLGRYGVEKVKRRVVYLNMEVGTRTMRRWLAEAGIVNTAAITVVNLRGKAGALNLGNDAGRAKFGQWLAEQDAEVVCLDPLAPLLAALALDENSNAEVAKFFAWWSEALMLGGVVDDLVVHHAGHGGERSRGASRLLDEPDAVWTLTKDSDLKQFSTDDPFADTSPTRYLSAYGRDVELPAEALSFDSTTRQLNLTGLSRAAMGNDDVQRTVKSIMSDMKLRTKETLIAQIGGNRKKTGMAIQSLIDDDTLLPITKVGKGWLLQYIPELGIDPRDLVAKDVE